VASLPSAPSVYDKKFPIVAEEAGAHTVIIEARIVEIAEHRFIGRVIHRELVLR